MFEMVDVDGRLVHDGLVIFNELQLQVIINVNDPIYVGTYRIKLQASLSTQSSLIHIE